MRSFKYALALMCVLFFAPIAEARPHPYAGPDTGAETTTVFSAPLQPERPRNTPRKGRKHRLEGGSYWAKPGRWCGWWMRTQFGGGPEFNLAKNWARRGSSAGGPTVGAVVVWPHHVGVITGKASGGRWIVKSGNDGGRVRERARSLGGAIAFRMI